MSSVSTGSDISDPSIPILDGSLQLPAIIFGAGVFSNQYNTDDHLSSLIPLQTIRLALRHGIKAIDTSTYYGPSEVVLGNVLEALRDEFPRSSYKLMTKCGRNGQSSFDYSPCSIRESVNRSLVRLKTTYLDTVYLHDVEFVCTTVAPRLTGNHSLALNEDASAYGLGAGDEAKIWGGGDQKVLAAFEELQKLQMEGLVRHIGITGYPLPTLLRLAILILHTPPYKPVDVILSYSHLTLQNTTLLNFAPHFYKRAQLRQLVAASPFSMGLLTSSPPPWHPAPPELRNVILATSKVVSDGLPNLALGYSISHSGATLGNVPLVVGFSSPQEVQACVDMWEKVQKGEDKVKREKEEAEVQNAFRQSGFLDWSWSSP